MSTEYHRGRHPNAYHEKILNSLIDIDKIANGNKSKFIYYFRFSTISRNNLNDKHLLSFQEILGND